MMKTHVCSKNECERTARFVLKLEVPFQGHPLGCRHAPLEMWTTIYVCEEHTYDLGIDKLVNQESIDGLVEASVMLNAPPPDIKSAVLVPVALISHAFLLYSAMFDGAVEAEQTSPTVN